MARLFGDAASPSVGRYRLRSLLGSGAHGQVFVADDPELGRQVAIKLVDAEPGREAEALARLSHPNVINVFDLGVDADQAFIVMELVSGRDLGRVLREDGLTHEGILALFRAAGRGLAAAHAAGLVHRDFKPTNVLVTEDGAVKVADFGLARGEPTPTPPGSGTDTSAAGTAAYMAPEQHDGERVDGRADQYAFCVALWEAVDGKLPFEGATAKALCNAKRRGVGGRVPANAPRWLAAVLRRGLAPSVADRYPTMEALLSNLHASGPRWGRAAVVGVTFVGAILAATLALRPQELCEGLQLDFSEYDRDEIATAFEATGLAAGAPQAKRVIAQLNDFSAAWTDTSETLCTTDRPSVRECLYLGRSEFDALVEALRAANAETVGTAWAAGAKLPDPESCLSASAPEEPVSPEERQVQQLLARVRVLQRTRQLESALVDALRADREAATLPPRTRTAACFRLGRIEGLSEQHEDSRKTLTRCFFDARENGEFSMAAASATHIANAALSLEDQEAAATWLRHAEADLERAGDPPGHRAPWLIARGRYADRQGKPAETLALFDEALGLIGDDPARIPAVLTGRGFAHRELGELHAAEADLRRSLELQTEQSGPGHPRLFAATNNLALVLQDRGELESARNLLESAHEMAIAGHGPGSPRALKALTNLGQLAFEQDDFIAAAEYNARALEGRRSAHGSDHASLGIPLLNLGNAVLAQERPHDAVPHYRESIRIFERHRGPDHPHTAFALTGLGAALRQTGDPEEAVKALIRAVEIRERTDALPSQCAESWSELALALEASGAGKDRTRAAQRKAEEWALLSERSKPPETTGSAAR